MLTATLFRIHHILMQESTFCYYLMVLHHLDKMAQKPIIEVLISDSYSLQEISTFSQAKFKEIMSNFCWKTAETKAKKDLCTIFKYELFHTITRD